VSRKELASHRLRPLAERVLALAGGTADRMPVRAAVEHMIAVTYGMTYDVVVTRFRPYETMIDEIVALVTRSVPVTHNPRSVKVLDIACGIGNVGLRLARRGYTVVAVDAVRHLIAIAREKHHSSGSAPNLSFNHLDIARDELPGAGSFDVLVSMHTLYWHPDPAALLAACRRALKPGGHAIFLTYNRPARVLQTFREVRRAEGLGAAVGALRWLVPTAVFEWFRDCDHRYMSETEFREALDQAGFDVLEAHPTFLVGLSHLAWARARE
jgi:2-polyprenyl-3-methyl-5-hydroxy-6-metoxy-1,4-benzoquinol methylase